MREVLDDSVAKLEEVLPPMMRGQGRRLIKRALLTFNRKGKDYKDLEPTSFIRCVLEAAELGLAIDGRLAHAVPFNNKYKDADGVERWRKEAQLMVDYKGMIAVARRCKIITHCDADVICENDEFEHVRRNDKTEFLHVPQLSGRGDCIGAYARMYYPDGTWHLEVMSIDDLQKVRNVSKAKNDGPWMVWFDEMCKKSVLRRALKLNQDDPAILRLMEIEDREIEEDASPEVGEHDAPPPPMPTGRQSMRNGTSKKPAEPTVDTETELALNDEFRRVGLADDQAKVREVLAKHGAKGIKVATMGQAQAVLEELSQLPDAETVGAGNPDAD